jgi:hypothetical protein
MTTEQQRDIAALAGLVLIGIGFEGVHAGIGWAVVGSIMLTTVVVGHLRSGAKPMQQPQAVAVGVTADGQVHFRQWPPQPGDKPPGNKILEDSHAAGTSPNGR